MYFKPPKKMDQTRRYSPVDRPLLKGALIDFKLNLTSTFYVFLNQVKEIYKLI